MSSARTGKAIIIGGSLGGLFAAGCLRRIGWEVEVCEKTSDDLASRGAGLGTHDEIFAVLEHLGIEVDEDIGVPIRRRYVMERDGSCSGKTLRASCMVMVEKPSEKPIAFTLAQTDPRMRM